MANEDESVWIVFNGEIYNFQELREGLLAKGHVFRSHSDTEVILHLYEDLGAECVTRLRGMWAYHLSATIPSRLLVVAGVPIRFTALQVSAGRGTWLAVTAPPSGIKIVTSFSDGTKITGMVGVQNI